jgi:hypothetical protein
MLQKIIELKKREIRRRIRRKSGEIHQNTTINLKKEIFSFVCLPFLFVYLMR